jgi:hypothetical protein
MDRSIGVNLMLAEKDSDVRTQARMVSSRSRVSSEHGVANMADENIAKWQQRLEEHFSYQGSVGGRLLPLVIEKERLSGAEFITTYKGYRVLADSFLDFFAETLNVAMHARQQVGWPKGHLWYAPCVLAFVTQFRGMRAAEILSMNGYPLDGYALQRNLKDQALLIGGVVRGITSFPALAGTRGVDTLKQWDETARELVFRNRLKEEVSVFHKMIGASSGLDGEQIAILKRWNRLFNMQVHGAWLTNYREADAWILQGAGPLDWSSHRHRCKRGLHEPVERDCVDDTSDFAVSATCRHSFRPYLAREMGCSR